MNKADEIVELLDKEVNVRMLMKKLTFDLDTFELANLQQPRLFLEAGRYLTWAVLKKVRAENSLESKVANEGLGLRESKKNGTAKGLTEKAIADMVSTNGDVIKSRNRLAMAKATEVWAKQLLEAYNHRLQVLNNITRIRTGEMASQLRLVKEKSAVDDLSKRAERVRSGFENDGE